MKFPQNSIQNKIVKLIKNDLLSQGYVISHLTFDKNLASSALSKISDKTKEKIFGLIKAESTDMSMLKPNYEVDEFDALEFLGFIKLLGKYKNGNALVRIYNDGTRITELLEGNELELDFPLNIDIRLMTKCDFGFNPTTGKSVCGFCHESARTDGVECDYQVLLEKLKEAELPSGIEIAVGLNDLTPDLMKFLADCKDQGWILNGTVNQGLLAKKGTQELLKQCIDESLLKGIGISFRPKMPKMPKWLLDHDNTVVHTIVGIDNFKQVQALKEQGVKKLLLLGEKNFGFNKGKVNLNSESHKEWKANFYDLTKDFDVVSFDNLALQQLTVKDKLNEETWETFYQGEHSFYINAVGQYFAPSSRSSLHNIPFDKISLRDYFKFLEKETIKLNIRDEE